MSTGVESKNGDSKFEALKLVYEQAAEKHSAYLSWREKLTGGYVAIIAALAIALWNIYEKPEMHFYLFIIFAAVLALSFVFKELDKRNATLYKAAQTVALTIEKELDLTRNDDDFNNTSLFYTLNNSVKLRNKELSHSALLHYVYNGMMLISGYFLIYSILFYNLKWDPNIEVRKWFNWCFIGSMWIVIVAAVLGMGKSVSYFYDEIRGKNAGKISAADEEIEQICDLILKFKQNPKAELLPPEIKDRIKKLAK